MVNLVVGRLESVLKCRSCVWSIFTLPENMGLIKVEQYQTLLERINPFFFLVHYEIA